MLITCPTGLSFDARRWNLGDQADLLDDKEDESVILPIRMVDMAFQKLVDPGPYPFTDAIDWQKVTDSDLTSASIQIRRYSKPVFSFNLPCQYCRKLDPEGLEIDLKDIVIFPASSAGIEVLRTGQPYQFNYKDDDGNDLVIKMRPTLCKDINLMSSLQKQEPKYILVIRNCMYIQEIAFAKGSGKAPIRDLINIKKFWIEQGWDFGAGIEDKIDELWGGPDLSFTYTCKLCKKEQDGSLPLDGSFYGLEQEARRRKRRRSFSDATSIEKSMLARSISSSEEIQDSPILSLAP